MLRKDPAAGEADFGVVAQWVGGARSRIEEKSEGIVTHLGGDGELSPMDALLASLAACDVHTFAMHAAALGLKIETLSIEAAGRANMSRFVGVDEAPGAGYDAISYTVRLHAPGATPEQIALLKEKCERASPVGDSLTKTLPLNVKFDISTSR